MQMELAWSRFMEQIDDIKNEDIPETFKKQFKTKDDFVYPRDKRFIPLARRVQTDEKLRTQRKWDKDCKMFLLWVMIKYFQSKGKTQVDPSTDEWEELSQILNLDKHQLKARWITLINPKQKSQNWTEQEDNIIKDSMKQRLHKHIWTQIAVRLYELNICPCARTPKQVRERWINYLNPNLRKDQWLMKEDLTILNIVLKKGKRWSYIAKKLEGRTENQVKNRYKSLINKIWTDEEMDEIEAIMIYVKRNQSAMNSTKCGMVGKRGRHKGNKKFQRLENNQNTFQNKNEFEQALDEVREELENESFISDSFSPKKKVKKEIKFEITSNNKTQYDQQKNNMILRSQKKENSFDDEQSQQGSNKRQKMNLVNFKDYQRDFSNYFNQLTQQQNNTDRKIELLNQAIDQLGEKFSLTSPSFQQCIQKNKNNNHQDNSCLLKSVGLTPDLLQPISNFNSVSPFQFKLNTDEFSVPAQKQPQDPINGKVYQLMNLYQQQMVMCLGSQPASALSLKGGNDKQVCFELKSPQIGLNHNLNSAILNSAFLIDFSPFGQRSAQMKKEKEGLIDDYINKDITNEQMLTPEMKQIQLNLEQINSDPNRKNRTEFLSSDNNLIAAYNKRRNITQQNH